MFKSNLNLNPPDLTKIAKSIFNLRKFSACEFPKFKKSLLEFNLVKFKGALKRLYVEQYHLIQTLCGGMGVGVIWTYSCGAMLSQDKHEY